MEARGSECMAQSEEGYLLWAHRSFEWGHVFSSFSVLQWRLNENVCPSTLPEVDRDH